MNGGLHPNYKPSLSFLHNSTSGRESRKLCVTPNSLQAGEGAMIYYPLGSLRLTNASPVIYEFKAVSERISQLIMNWKGTLCRFILFKRIH